MSIGSGGRNGIATRKHRVVLCKADDIILDCATIVLKRTALLEYWARITPTRSSLLGRDGFAVADNREKPTHRIHMKYRSDMVLASTAWVYERLLKSPPRWYKLLDVRDDCIDNQRYLSLECRLVEAGDDIVEPQQVAPASGTGFGAMPLPVGVKL
jgi:hypothetical protein